MYLVTGRQARFRRCARLTELALVTSIVLLGSPGDGTCAPPDGPVRLTDAAERGAFTVVRARADVRTATDPVAGDVLHLDYTSAAGHGGRRLGESVSQAVER